MSDHHQELERRYIGIDYVAEFQRHWSYFNAWLRAEFGQGSDRDLVERFKADQRAKQAVDRGLELGHHELLIKRMSGAGKWVGDLDMYRYFTQTTVSTFVAAAFQSQSVKRALNLFGGNPDARARESATIHVAAEEFVELYRAVMGQGDRFMSEEIMSVREALSYHQIDYSGGAFRRDPSISRTHRSSYAEGCWAAIHATDSLEDVKSLAGAAAGPGTTHDIIELMYVVRNLAVHGQLDFLKTEENAVARAALTVLDTIVALVTQRP